MVQADAVVVVHQAVAAGERGTDGGCSVVLVRVRVQARCEG